MLHLKMYSLRKWIFKPKKSDTCLLAQFFYADDELNGVAGELDSFDGRKDPERCTQLVSKLRVCQDRVLGIVEQIMQDAIQNQRAPRDFRVKFPDDVLQESLAGQLWFGAECLAAGSSIMNREVESASMRPLARTLTRHLDHLRTSLRDQSLRNPPQPYTLKIRETLAVFDRLFAEFELSYVSAMVPVKTMKEYDMTQDVIVLFCETVQRPHQIIFIHYKSRIVTAICGLLWMKMTLVNSGLKWLTAVIALRLGLLTQEMIDDYDPALMFTIPRLAIVCGLMVFPEGPLNPDMDPMKISEMFRPFQTLLYKIRELLWTLSKRELWLLEKSLCSAEEPGLYRDVDHINLEEDLDNITCPSDTNMKELSAFVGDLIEDDSVSEGGTCTDQDDTVMSLSESLATIVASQDGLNQVQSTADRAQRLLSAVPWPDTIGIPHQDSNDSGMLSETDSASPVARCRQDSARRLRHSRSWPEEHNVSQSSMGSDDDLFGSGASMPGSMDTTDETRWPSHNHTVSFANPDGRVNEFTFHLPVNTQQEESSGSNLPMSPAIPVVMVTGEDSESTEPLSRLIISNSHQTLPDDPLKHVSFVTDTLNQVFVTDTNFFQEPDKAPGITVSDQCDTKSSPQSMEDAESADSADSADSPSQCTSSSLDSADNSTQCDTDIIPSETCDTNTPCDKTLAIVSSCESEDVTECSSRHHSRPGQVRTNNTRKTVAKPSTSHNKQKHKPTTVPANANRHKRAGSEGFPKSSAAKEDTLQLDGSALAPGASTRSRSPTAHHDMLGVPATKLQKTQHSTAKSGFLHTVGLLHKHSPSHDYDFDRESYASSDTSSYNSESHDDEEIALAIQAAELAARQEARSRFRSSTDLIHRLFVCISGVADQLQTNYAGDLRNILKAVFECYSFEPLMNIEDTEIISISDDSGNAHMEDRTSLEEAEEETPERSPDDCERDPPPAWVPDDESPYCMSCKVPFTFVRRRHHCRNCGKIFCGRCSSNSVPLPHYGHSKPVRVCNHCFVFQVTPFTMNA